MQRKLAAILAADVVGYSRLMGADDVGTLRAFTAGLRETVQPAIAIHRGRLVNSAGDGLLMEFTSVVDAVSCAVIIQRGMASRYPELPEERRIRFRMGINLGEIIAEDSDIHGDGVNVAARLEALAEPGGICVSGAVFEQVRDKLPIAFADRGEQALKNIAHPVHVYSLDTETIAALTIEPPSPSAQTSASTWNRRGQARWYGTAGLVVALGLVLLAWSLEQGAGTRMPTASRFSLIVLPFANLSGDATQDYIADVITEELTSSLARIPQTFVIARSTAFTYKGKSVDIKQMGRDLGVRYALEGSTQAGDTRLRVNAQLVDTETGSHLWAEQFDAARTDLLDMQDEIVTRLSRALQWRLVEVDAARVSRTHSANLDAEDLALRCEMALLNAGPGNERMEAGYQLCQQALQQDPGNVRALTNLAFKFIDRVLEVQSTDREADIVEADELVSRALAKNPNAYPAHFAKAEVLLAQKNFEEAIVEAERSLALNPSFVNAYSALCTASSLLGRPAQAIEYAEKAMRLSPRDSMLYVFQFHKGFALSLLDQNERAIEWLRRAIAGAPQWPLPQALLASVLAMTGRGTEAAVVLQRYLALPATQARTVAQWKAQMPSDNPVFVTFATRLADGLGRAGMPKE